MEEIRDDRRDEIRNSINQVYGYENLPDEMKKEDNKSFMEKFMKYLMLMRERQRSMGQQKMRKMFD